MSPKLRWPGGRRGASEGRHSAASPAPETGSAPARGHPGAESPDRAKAPELGLSPGGLLVAERIEAAATGGRDGALHLVGEPGGLVHLAGGRILLVQTPAAPGVDLLAVHRTTRPAARAELAAAVGTPDGRDAVLAQAQQLLGTGSIPLVALDALHQQAVADAAWALLAADGVTLVRSRFFRGERPWTRLTRPVSSEELVAEAARRRRVLDRHGGAHRSDVRPARVERLPRAVRLDPLQWELIAHADGRRTVRELAWLIGRGVFATLVEVARLQRLGLLAGEDLQVSRP